MAGQLLQSFRRRRPRRADRARCPTTCPRGCLTNSCIVRACSFMNGSKVCLRQLRHLEGELRHEKLETRADLCRTGRGGAIHSRSVMLLSDTYGLIAKWIWSKATAPRWFPWTTRRAARTRPKAVPQAWPADRIQMAAQALVLRDNGYRCDEAVLYYDATRQRVRLPIDDALVAETRGGGLNAARTLAEKGTIPPPLIDSPKCPRCSLVGICLPDETALGRSLTIRGIGPAALAVRRQWHQRPVRARRARSKFGGWFPPAMTSAHCM